MNKFCTDFEALKHAKGMLGRDFSQEDVSLLQYKKEIVKAVMSVLRLSWRVSVEWKWVLSEDSAGIKDHFRLMCCSTSLEEPAQRPLKCVHEVHSRTNTFEINVLYSVLIATQQDIVRYLGWR